MHSEGGEIDLYRPVMRLIRVFSTVSVTLANVSHVIIKRLGQYPLFIGLFCDETYCTLSILKALLRIVRLIVPCVSSPSQQSICSSLSIFSINKITFVPVTLLPRLSSED